MNTNRISKNKVVSITYSILDEQGQVVEQSDVPVEYIHGVDNPLFEKIEEALDGKNVGDSIDVELNPEEGFGPHRPELTFTDDIENVPPEYRYIGAKPVFQNEKGEDMELVVTRIENGKLTVDANHPFAGRTMSFNVTVFAVRDASSSELANGVAQQKPKLH